MGKLGIFGTSGFAREVADIVYELEYDPFFIARNEEKLDAWVLPERIVLESEIHKIFDAKFIVGIGGNTVRERLVKRYDGKLDFINIVHPSASFGRAQRGLISLRKGIVVCAGVGLTNNIKIGDFTVLNLNLTIGHDVVIGSFVNIAPGAHVSGNVHIEERCWIGTGAVVNHGSNNNKLVVGFGAVVIKDCEEESVYVGAPARKIR